MTRARNNPASKKRRKRILEKAKGFRGARKSQIRLATEATNRAMAFAYRGRKEKKRDFRALWITRISAAAKINGISYSTLINGLNKLNINLNRKVLSDIAIFNENVFAQIAELVKKSN
ncbi:50S ribosomal protein L20 [bacterium]|nr:50S ribosomal protein L20 [bacterium]